MGMDAQLQGRVNPDTAIVRNGENTLGETVLRTFELVVDLG